MAQIVSSSPEKIITIKQFKGLNECRDGDTKIGLGEASVCLNWKVTRDGNLQRRQGQTRIAELGNAPVRCLWNGWVGGKEYLLAACNGKLYKIYDGNTDTFPVSEIGSVDTTNFVHIFGFESKAYILDGEKYRQWDGATLSEVEGYIPLVINAKGPDGTTEAGGATLEQINKLSSKRRVWISPDGINSTWTLPEDISSVDYIKLNSNGSVVPASDYTVSGNAVTFSSAPPLGANTYEICYSVSGDMRAEIVGMRFSEIYSGVTDKRVFLYGDGTNELLFSDIDYNGTARADYFPDLNEIAVGDSNTPVTGIVRHFSSLICYKLDSTWNITTNTMSLADGSLISSFNVIPVNRTIGNEAPGQIFVCLNSPRTLYKDELYEWKSNTSYSGNLSYDERQAIRISDRIYNTLSGFDFPYCVCYDDNAHQEYYIAYRGTALVHNYAVNAWYKYDNLPATMFATIKNELYFGTDDGRIEKFDETAKDDDGTAINAVYESGFMDFGADYARKYSSTLWVTIKPQTNSYVVITARTNKKDDYAEKLIAYGTGGFANLDFRSFSFRNTLQPQVKKLRLKAKKYEFYKIIFLSDVAHTTATILSLDIRMRQTGYAK